MHDKSVLVHANFPIVTPMQDTTYIQDVHQTFRTYTYLNTPSVHKAAFACRSTFLIAYSTYMYNGQENIFAAFIA